jgi:heterodisulfide reductase subunit C
MLMQYKLTSRDLFSDLDMGLVMFLKGKIHPLPQRIAGLGQIQRLFAATGKDVEVE